jgi:hypothetical protein
MNYEDARRLLKDLPIDSLDSIELQMAIEMALDEGEDIEPCPGVREPLKPRPGRDSGSVAVSPPDPEEWF